MNYKFVAIAGLIFALSSSGMAQRSSRPPILPDSTLTPGDTLDVTADDICATGYTKAVRNVPLSVKQKVYESYAIFSHQPGEYEVDHLISLELGGSNSIRNLWPESYLTSPYNAHVKDRLENYLHKRVCNGSLSLKQAQNEIAVNWVAAYKKYLGETKVANLPRRRARHRVGKTYSGVSFEMAGGQVWVNTRSKKYFLPGSRYYGKTSKGIYMSEHDAIHEGFRVARGR